MAERLLEKLEGDALNTAVQTIIEAAVYPQVDPTPPERSKPDSVKNTDKRTRSRSTAQTPEGPQDKGSSTD